MTTTQTNMPSPDSPKNTNLSSKPMRDEDFTALPGTHTTLTGHHNTLPTSTVNHDPYGHPDPKSRITPSHYATVSDSILGYANKAHDMVLGPTMEKNIKARSVSTEDQAREMIGAGIPSYSLDKKSSLLGSTLKTTTTTTSLTTGIDRTTTHSPTLYDSIATDNPAVAFGEPEDDMAMFEVKKYRSTHPWIKKSNPLDTHLLEMIADVRVNNGGFDEAEDAMAMYEASKYHSLHEQQKEKQREQQIEKQRAKENTKRMNQMVDPSWINVE